MAVPRPDPATWEPAREPADTQCSSPATAGIQTPPFPAVHRLQAELTCWATGVFFPARAGRGLLGVVAWQLRWGSWLPSINCLQARGLEHTEHTVQSCGAALPTTQGFP